MDTFDNTRRSDLTSDSKDQASLSPPMTAAASQPDASFEIKAMSSGRHDVVVSYANGWSEARSARVDLSDGRGATIEFPTTGSWNVTGEVTLNAWLDAGTTRFSFSGPSNLGPSIKGLKASLLTGEVDETTHGHDTLVLVQNIAAITALDALSRLTPAQAHDGAHAQGAGRGEASSQDAATDASRPSDDAPAGIAGDAQDATTFEPSPQPTQGFDLKSSGSDGAGSAPRSDASGGARIDVPQGDAPQGPLSTATSTTISSAPAASASGAVAPAIEEGEAPVGGEDLSVPAAAAEADLVEEPTAPTLPLRLQAESATRGNAVGGTLSTSPAVVDSTTASPSDRANAAAASGGAYVDFSGLNGNFNAGSGEFVEWKVAVATSGFYDLAFGYAFFSGGASNRPMQLEVNGKIWDRLFDFTSTGANTTYGEAGTRVFLSAGDNTVRLTANGFSGPNVDYLEVRTADSNKIVIQAESLLPTAAPTAPTTINRQITLDYLEGKPTAEQFRVGAEGDAYIDWAGGADSQTLDLPVTVAVAGTYSISITYANGGGAPRPISLVGANGQTIGTFNFVPTTAPTAYPDLYADIDAPVRPTDGADEGTVPDPTGFEGWTKETLRANGTQVSVTLAAGVNTLRLVGAGGPNIDKIEFDLIKAAPAAQAPTDIAVDNLSLAENAVGAVIGNVAVMDTDSTSHTFQVLENGVASQRFEVSGGALRLKAGISLDYEAQQKSFPLTIVATDAQGGSVTRAFTVTLTNDPSDDVVNRAPVIASSTFTADENQTAVGTVVASDADSGDTLAYALTANAASDNALFLIDAATGALTFKTAPDYEALPNKTLTVEVAVSDGKLTTTKTIAVTVADINETPANAAPVFTAAPSSVTINENTSVVGSFAATDANNDPLSYSLSGSDAGLFEISPSGQLSFRAPPNAEAPADAGGNGVYDVTVTASDGLAQASTAVAVTVANVNEAPTLSGTISPATLPATGGRVVLSGLVATDPDGTAPSLGVRAASGTLPSGIAVVDGSLVVADTVALGSYQLQLFASDGSLVSDPVALSLTIQPKPIAQILIQAEAGALTILDVDDNTNDTTIRNPWNKEASTVVGLVDGLRPGFSGSGYLDFGDTAGDRATYSFTLAEAGSYDIQIRYASAGNRPLAFSLDGAAQNNLPFLSTDPDGAGAADGFNDWSVQKVTVQLAAGTHSFSLAIPAGADRGPNLDAIAITAAGATADFSAGNAAPVVAETGFSVAEGTLAAGRVTASDLDGDRVDFALTANAATDNALFTLDARTGALRFKAAPNFEVPADAGADNAYTVEVEAFDGTARVTKTLTVRVTNDPSDDVVNRAPVIASSTFTADENQTAVGTVVASDADAGDTLAYALTANTASDNALFLIDAATGALTFKTAPNYEALANKTLTVEVAVSDGKLTTTKTIAVTVADVSEGGPVAIKLGAIAPYSAQDRPQDGGAGAALVDGGTGLSLDGNLWKRAAIDTTYSLTATTKLVFDVAIGTGAEVPEIAAIGFDFDEDPFDADRSIYQLGGTQNQQGFIDLRGKGTPNANGTLRFEIDLGAHAGKTLAALVFVNDDDSRASLGSSSYSNLQFVERTIEVGNRAPTIVGGGIADRTIPENGSLEIDLPFADADGDALTYGFVIRNGAGTVIAAPAGLAVVDGVLTGPLAALGDGVFTVTVTASDGKATVEDSFKLTVENVNQAPVAEDVALEPYLGSVGAAFEGFDVNGFAEYFSDPDGDPLTLSVEGLPDGLKINEEGYVSGSPKVDGTFEITVRATDASGLSDTITLTLVVEGPQMGEVVSVEAEAFTNLGAATGFFATGSATASGDRLILLNQGSQGSVSTELSKNGLAPGYYKVTLYAFDETDGASTLSVTVGDTKLTAGGSSSVTLNDGGAGTFVNPGAPRGTTSQAGNLKAIAFDTVVFVDADTVATLAGQAGGGESLRIDRVTFTRVEAPNTPPSAVTLTGSVNENAAGAVVGVLAAADAENDAVTFTATDARFVIAKNAATGAVELRLAAGTSLNHETDNGTTVSVTATDSAGNATTTSLTLRVNDVNEAPVLSGTIAGQSFKAGEGGEVNLAALSATDPDAGDAVSLVAKLASGANLPAGFTVENGILKIAGTLAAGTYEVVVFATDGEADSRSVSFTVTVEAPGTEQPEPFQPIVIQAETGTIALAAATDASSTQIRSAANPETGSQFPGGTGLRPDFSGTGYLDFGNDAGDRVSYTVTVAEAGTYNLAIRYASNDLRPLDLAVNGGAATQVAFASTDPNATGVTPEGFDVWGTLTQSVQLQAGANTLSFAIPAGRTNGPNLDRIEITAPVDTTADADGNLFLSGPDAPLTGAAKESINFTIAGRDADIVKTEISFDGGITRTTVLPDADGDFVASGSGLAAGPHTATVIVTDRAGNTASTTMPFTVGAGQVTVPPFTIQAEDATRVTVQDTGSPSDAAFTRVVTANAPDASGNYRAGATGGAYMDFGANAGDAVTVNVDAPQAGTYTVTFRYANGGVADRPLDLSLNGATATAVAFVPGPVVGTGATASGWESWVEKTVDVTLAKGANTLKLTIPTGSTAGPNIDQITFTHKNATTPSQPFDLTIEAETFTPIDTTGTDAELTQARTAANPETRSLPRDVDNNSLWDGFTGTGYLDMGTQAGDAASFNVSAPDAGTYTFSFRYSNGGGAPNGDRPMTVLVNGVTKTVSFPGTGVDGWDAWRTATVELDLAAGQNLVRIANSGANGPNIDSVTISRDGDGPVDTREQIRFQEVIKVNFEPAPGQTTQGLPAGYATPAGYRADTGAAFGERGNGFSYGWVTEASVADGTANGTIAAAQPANAHWYKNTVSGATTLQKTYAHFEYPGAGADGARAWEMALENGTYQVTMSVGDTAGAFDSNYRINIEGQSAMPAWTPANPIDGSQNGGGFRSTLVTKMVTVTDGRLTIDSIGGTNTEIQYLEVERVADLTPGDNRTADLDYSMFVAPVAANLEGQRTIALGQNGELPTGIDPSSSFVVGVQLQAAGNRGPNIAYTDHVKLVETLTGVEVNIDVQISGGADSLTIRPLQQLKENVSYTLKVQDVLDLGSISNSDGALRQFQDLTSTFVTGKAVENVPREVAFSTQTLLDGFADGAGGYTSIEFGPDGKLYVATITGEIHRWSVNTNGTINKASQETLSLDYLKEADGDRRGIVGFAFDPENPNTIWISDNAPIPREAKAFDTPEFSGRISKLTLGTNGSFTGVSAETYIHGLPRSGGDHLTNSLEFRANPNAAQAGESKYLLYVSQGSNSAAGAPDDAWGARPERLLNAAILEVDPRRSAPNGGFNVSTEPVSPTDDPKKSFPASAFNSDGTYPGSYNPFAADAVLKIFATGVRNAYDLVWHSNGKLYVPTNGTASGGRTPNDPTQPGLDTVISNSPKQYDYFFTVEEGKYYGHPNVLRDEYVLNGGNPTAGLDPNEVVGGNDGNRNTDGYQTGVRPDGNYDLDGVYNLGYNRSPNGATEYKGNAFGTNLKGAILFAQFSTGDNVRVIKVDAQGNIIGDDVLRRPDGSVIDDYIDPLDIIENPVTGQLYLMTLNRGTGASQLILLTPAPGGVTADLTADEGGDLALVALDVSDPSKAVFQVNGLDSDITAIRVAFGSGAETAITLDAQGRFTVDLGSLSGSVIGRLRVTDDALNQATATTTFTPGQEPTTPQYVTLVTIQAEDRSSADGTSVTVATGQAAQIQIRDAANPEPGVSGAGYVDGLRPGAFGTDGNTNNGDGVPGGYADFGSTNADFMTFAFSAETAGSAVLKFRYANGGAADRPLQLEVNGTIVKVQSFAPTTTATITDGWTNWAEVEVPVTLAAGQNTVTLRSINATGPNIDQMVVMVPAVRQSVPNDGEVVVDGVTYVRYEAEKADFAGEPAIVTENRNQSGQFIDFLGPDTESITWTVEVGAAGSYGVDILYALGAGKDARPMTIAVNGQLRETLPFAANSNAAESLWGAQSATLQLAAGVNTITLAAPGGVGPNVDLLRITKSPVTVFEANPADIVDAGRIELETQDGSARTVNGSTVDFFFTVAGDGVYKIDTAANANAANGQGLTWLLNGVEVDESAFPGIGQAGETSIYLELKAGTDYQLRLVSDAPGASALDYLDVSRAPGNPNADIAVRSLDPAFLDNRLHFSYLEDPDFAAPDAGARDFKASATVRISNTGTEALTLTAYELSGPFVLADPAQLNGLSIAAGRSVDVTVNFNRAAYTPPTSNVDTTSTVFQGTLKLITNDADDPVTTIDLAGFWQARDEGGQEPNVNEVWKIFGFGNVIEGLTLRGGGENSTLSTNDVFAKTDPTEVLSPYWKLADGVSEAKVTQIAAFHGPHGSDIRLHNPNNKGQNVLLLDHQGTDNQRLLPNAPNGTDFATGTFNNARIPDGWAGNEVFGISVSGLSTDPRLNPRGDIEVPGALQGHTVKMFQALDAKGNVIPNVYLGIMDYTGINYDYNDNMFVIEGVQPVGFGQDLRIAGLDDAAADERLVFTSIDQPANAQQAFRNEATFTITNDGFAALDISSIVVGDPASFQIVGTVPTTIAAGGSAQVTVRFVGTHSGTTAGADLFKSTLTITSNDFADGVKVVQLAGLAQEFSERDSEPTAAQVVEAFGYATDMAQGQLADGGKVEAVGDEVIMPYLQRLDASRPVEVIQIAAFLNQGNVARLGVHGLNSSQVTNLFANDDQQGQTVLPDQLVPGAGAGASVARGVINPTAAFGLYVSVDGRPTYSSWTDPEANKIDPNFGQLVGDDQGHLIRFFKALDKNGNVIAGTFIGIQDYPGAGNYDYNDHMFVIKNVQAHVLTPAEDANGDGINDALQLDADRDGTVNFFDTATTPPPGAQQPFGGTAPVVRAAPVTIDATRFDNGGQGVAYNDTSPQDEGGTAGRNEGVDVIGNNAAVGWIDGGEWIEYTINVERAGLHSLSFAAATPEPGRTITASFEQNGVTYTTAPAVAVVDTNNYTTFTPTAPIQLNLAAGIQTVRLTFGGGTSDLFDFDSFTLDRVNVAPTVAQTLGAQSATQNQAFSFVLPAGLFTDVDGDALTLSVTGLPAGLRFDAATRVISGTPTGAGASTIQVTASDGSASVSTNFALAVSAGPATAEQTPFGAVPAFVGGVLTVDASNYDNGGQGIAYNDTPGLQGGTNGGRTGSSVEQTSAGDIGWVDDGEWVEYTINVATAGRYDLDLLLSNGWGAGPSASVAFYKSGAATPYATSGTIANPGTGDWGTFVNRGIDGLALEAGVQIVRVSFAGGAQDFRSFTLTSLAGNQQPFGGTAPKFVNGALTVDASNFDDGGQGVAYNDNPGLDGGNTAFRPGRDVEMVGTDNDLGYIKPGEWVEYTLEVPKAGTYTFSVNAKTPVTGATVTLSEGGSQLGVVTLADGHAGGSNFGNAPFAQSAAVPIVLEAGVQTLRLAFGGPLASNGYVLDLKSFSLTELQTPVGTSAPILEAGEGLTIDASNYDNGGQGVAYNDGPGLEGGTNGGRAGSSVEQTAGGDIGWTASGEWLEYTISVEEAGTYDLNLSMALGEGGGPNRTVTATFTNGSIVETVTVATPRTGDWSNFQNTAGVAVDLEPGVTVVRLTFNGGNQDLRSFSLTPTDQDSGVMRLAMSDLGFAGEDPAAPVIEAAALHSIGEDLDQPNPTDALLGYHLAS